MIPREDLQEDESGSLQASVNDILYRAKRRQLMGKVTNVRLGMVSGHSIYICVPSRVNQTLVALF